MKIYKYNPNCKEWEDVRNSKLVGIERKNAFNECIKNIGVELTLQEYFATYPRESDFTKGISYCCIGEPTNILERLAYSEIEYDNELSYIHRSKASPEDFVESRTSYEDMIDYADGLAYFIDSLKDEIGRGNLIYKE